MFLDRADRDSQLRGCGFVAHALKTYEHESRPRAGGQLGQGLGGDQGFLLGL